MKIGKYEFNSKEQAQGLIDALGTATDEDGNTYPTHKNSIANIGFAVLEQGTYDEDGNEITAPVISDKYHVDVCWVEDEHPEWSDFRVEVQGEGLRSFFGLNYQELKVV